MANPGHTALLAIGMPDPRVLEAVSGVFGSISMVAWIFVILPQLFVNYRAKNADGISMTFLIVWMLGDVCNLTGAIFTNLAPTAIALACYFCFADCALISQCLYYNAVNSRRAARQNALDPNEPEERSPLLRRRSGSPSLPGSHRRRATHTESSMEPIMKLATGEDETLDSRPWLHNSLALLAVHLIGFAGWFLSYKAGAWKNSEPGENSAAVNSKTTLETVGLVLGYISALFYLCARIPQIIKNYRQKSCEGLSLLFFLLSLTGNGTYGISLVTYSQDKKYLLNSIPWLLGSVGTMLEDSTIFVQFQLYAKRSESGLRET